MTPVDVIGWSAAVVGAFFTMPQFVRVLRTDSTAGLSVPGWQLGSGVGLAWACHGVIYSMPNQIAANVVVSSASLGVVYFLIRHRRLSVVRTLLPIVVVALVLTSIDLWFGQLAFGLVALFPGSAGLLAQLRDLIRAPDFTGVSPGFLVLGMVIQSLWFSWSLMAGDVAVTITSSAAWLLLASNLSVWIVRTHALHQQRDALARSSLATKVGS